MLQGLCRPPLVSFHVRRPKTKPSTQLATTMHAYVYVYMSKHEIISLLL
jgi:hypothetical protein